MISTGERDHGTLLTDQNLIALVRDSDSYVVPTLPRFVTRVLVPEEQFVLKNLPFYEEAQAANAKARQDRLAQREKKRNEGMVRQVQGRSRPASSSTAHPPSKKKSVTRPVEKALDLSPSSPSHSPPSEEVSPDQDSIGLPSVEGRSNQELEPMISCINLEPEEKEAQMALNLRVGLKERQRKHLF